MANVYENIAQEFIKNNCKLLTTKEEHAEILKISKKCNYKLNYTASCGHNHNVFYNVFKSRGTGIICPSCKRKKTGIDIKEKMNNNEISKLTNIEQEFNSIKKIKEYLVNDFIFLKAFDGCKVDIIFKPKNVEEDKWVGIQVKTTKERRLTYSFHINNNYDDCLLILYCIEDESIWLVPENIIKNQSKISIGYNKSKYNIYKVKKENIVDKLKELYKTTRFFRFDELNLPINLYQQREQEYRKYRQEKIQFIKFDYHEMEGTTFDFMIGNLKIQEKISVINSENRCHFCIYKNNGVNNFKKYNKGDNDFYWLNCDDKKTFFVIPEKILIDRGIIGGEILENCKKQLKITIQKPLHSKSKWLSVYMFDYENIDKERLLNTLSI